MFSIVYAMGQPAGGAQGTQGTLFSFLPLVLIFVIFYFLLIRPQAQRQKKLKEMINSLKKGDKVVTNGGLHGTVVGFKGNNIVTLTISEKVNVDVSRSSISGSQTEKQAD